MSTVKIKSAPLRKTMCKTCPFRAGSPYADLAGDLAASALSDSSRICHSTGSNGIHRRTGIKPHLCRGARQVQLSVFASMGVIESPTDESWNKKRVEMGMAPTVVADPVANGAKRSDPVLRECR